MRYYLNLLILSIAVVLLSGCDGNEKDPSTEDNDKDRQEILVHWANNIIKPSYAKFKVALDDMTIKSNAFTTAPSLETLAAFRTSWKNAYIEWQNVEQFEFGPADKYTMRNFFNIYPADIAGITMNINDATATLDIPSAYARQGFPALDYLINGAGPTDTDIVNFYVDAAEGQNRKAYVSKIVQRMGNILSNVINEWEGSYYDTFISRTGLDIGSSMGLVVNAWVLNYERYIRSGKIGIPAGALVAGGGSVQPEKVEAVYKKDISKTLALTANKASRDFFNGKSVSSGIEGPSFKSYLDALDAKDATSGKLLSTLINERLDAVDTKINLLTEDFNAEAKTNPQRLLDVFTEMQGVVRMIKVDMTSAMSITITYTDNDGD